MLLLSFSIHVPSPSRVISSPTYILSFHKLLTANTISPSNGFPNVFNTINASLFYQHFHPLTLLTIIISSIFSSCRSLTTTIFFQQYLPPPMGFQISLKAPFSDVLFQLFTCPVHHSYSFLLLLILWIFYTNHLISQSKKSFQISLRKCVLDYQYCFFFISKQRIHDILVDSN